MCKCRPNVRTPFCGAPGCEWPKQPTTDHFTLRAANLARGEEWQGNTELPASFWSTELAGECGEACNVVKKLERERYGLKGSRDTVDHLAEELADVIICVDLLAIHYGINLDQAVRDKFNATSEKMGFKTRLVP